MNEVAVAEVETGVRDGGMPEIDPISRLKLIRCDRHPHPDLFGSRTRQRKTAGGEHVFHKARAVYPADGIAAPVVGNAQVAIGFANKSTAHRPESRLPAYATRYPRRRRKGSLCAGRDDLILQQFDFTFRQPSHRVIRHEDAVPVACFILDRDIGSGRRRRQFGGAGAACPIDRSAVRQLAQTTDDALRLASHAMAYRSRSGRTRSNASAGASTAVPPRWSPPSAVPAPPLAAATAAGEGGSSSVSVSSAWDGRTEYKLVTAQHRISHRKRKVLLLNRWDRLFRGL